MRIAYFRKIVKIGNSNCVVVPRDVRMLIEAKEGDWVRIEIEKVVIKNDTNLHDDNAARQDPEARNKGIHQDA